MKLDRNISPGHPGKYALIKLRELPPSQPMYVGSGNEMLSVNSTSVDFGDTPDTEFFVIRLKDKYAHAALNAYAAEALKDDSEYALEIRELAKTALNHPNKSRPT